MSTGEIITAAEKDRRDRAAIDRVASAARELNDALRVAMARKIRIEFGVVSSRGGDQKSVSSWQELWTKDGLAVRFTREEMFAAPEPPPPVQDDRPNITGES